MSLSVVQSNSITSGTSASPSLQFLSNNTARNVLMVMFEIQGASTSCTSISCADTSGNVWTPVWGSIQSPSGGTINKFIQGFTCINKTTTSGGGTTVTITSNGASISTTCFGIFEISGFSAGTLVIDSGAMSTAAAGASGTMVPLTLTTLANNEAVLAFSVLNAVVTLASPAAPFTSEQPSPTATNIVFSIALQATAGSANYSGTWTGYVSGGNTSISAAFGVYVLPPPANADSSFGFGFKLDF